ncbi:kinesin motor domain-containing protein [Lentinula lateritia]|nr:kinesin motor domain-containing protein [Lentinula lateritia]
MITILTARSTLNASSPPPTLCIADFNVIDHTGALIPENILPFTLSGATVGIAFTLRGWKFGDASWGAGDSLSTSNKSFASPSPGSGRVTPSGRQTPGPGGTHGGPRLQSRDGRSVQTSVLSLIDLAGSEKATSDKERMQEGKYINTSLLTLGTVISKLSDNATKQKNDHIPFHDSKLTRLLQPSLSGNTRISVICTINPDPSPVAESTSTLLFAKRVKGMKLHAQKKEVIDTDALIERYRKEIDDLNLLLGALLVLVELALYV